MKVLLVTERLHNDPDNLDVEALMRFIETGLVVRSLDAESQEDLFPLEFCWIDVSEGELKVTPFHRDWYYDPSVHRLARKAVSKATSLRKKLYKEMFDAPRH